MQAEHIVHRALRQCERRVRQYRKLPARLLEPLGNVRRRGDAERVWLCADDMRAAGKGLRHGSRRLQRKAELRNVLGTGNVWGRRDA